MFSSSAVAVLYVLAGIICCALLSYTAGGGTDVLPEASPEVCAGVDAVGGSSWVIFSLGGRADTRAGLADVHKRWDKVLMVGLSGYCICKLVLQMQVASKLVQESFR